MVMASWPSSRRGREYRVAESARRRTDEAMRLATRQAVRVGVPLVAVAMGADALHLVLRFGPRGILPAALDAAAAVVVLILGIVTTRYVRHPEPFLLPALLAVFAVPLANSHLLPELEPLTNAYLAVTLVGSALFLPWAPAWHNAWLTLAVGFSAVSFGASIVLGEPPSAAASQLLAAAAGGFTSMVGQVLVHGRTRRMLEQHFELRRLSRFTQQQEREVAKLNRDLVRTASLDTVTGIGNRRALDNALVTLAGQRLAAVLLDVDHFKAFNDRNGHLAGDAALARVGEILRDIVRVGDLVFRYGGEEFLVLLPGGDRDGAVQLAERVRGAVETDRASGTWGLTVSAGVAVADRFSASSPLPLLRRADAALYQAKRTGRNRVVFDDPGAATLSPAAS
jgi:diguanylate cyclase (GGDEF)-like protein